MAKTHIFLLLFVASTLITSASGRADTSVEEDQGVSRFIHRHLAEGPSNGTNVNSGGKDAIVPTLKSHVACPAASQPSRSAQCEFVRNSSACGSDAQLDYVNFYFCTCQSVRILGFIVLLLWLASLFFMLGNTAADYFCPALEELSSLLNLAPTVAGVTLLPLGNGAPDVFASIASFMGSQQGEVGLNSVLGAGCFVICVVAGSVCIAVSRRPGTFKVDRLSFLRDVGFYLVCILALLAIVLVGKVSLLGALAFLSLYAVYGALVAYHEVTRGQKSTAERQGSALSSPSVAPGAAVQLQPLLSVAPHNLPQWMWIRKLKPYRTQLAHPHLAFTLSADRRSRSLRRPRRLESERSLSAGAVGLLGGVFPRFSSDTSATSDYGALAAGPSFHDAAAAAVSAADFRAELKRIVEGKGESDSRQDEELEASAGRTLQPQYDAGAGGEEEEEGSVDEGLMWGWEEETDEPALWYTPAGIIEYFIKLPLTLPRMLTVPVHSKDSWSRTWFTVSATLAPVFAIFIVLGPHVAAHVWLIGACVGIVLGITAYTTSTKEAPPTILVPFWVVCGFVLSILWFYAIANELVALLVTFGIILEIDTAVLGLTVLAWGNSIGDYVANLALVQSGGPSRVQISWSGCIAGPLFNMLVGLGASMVISAWNVFPNVFIMPEDPSLPEVLLFLFCVLLFVILWLPSRDMKLDKTMGVILIGSYCAFISVRLLQIMGVGFTGGT